MKKFVMAIAAVAMSFAAYAQSVSLYKGGQELMNYSTEKIDSIVFSDATAAANGPVREVNAHWCALGTSITWYNENVASSGGRFTRGYQSRVMDKIAFSQYSNKAVNGGVLSSALNNVIKADYYTIEHGINDWGKGNDTPVGTIDDYINNTKNGTFAATYRQLIDKIYETNPDAKVILCTPRKAYGFNNYLPAHWYDASDNTGVYLKEYADLIRQIADYESMPLADFFNLCGGQHNLHRLSIDTALHPNDAGYQLMANVLIKAFEKIIVD